jgi:predicted CXXCH cytochrome family protein
MAHAIVRGLLAAVGLTWALGAQPAAAGDTYVAPGSKAAGLDSCVEPTEFMRRNHMELIKHERHIVVHQGIRDSKYKLAGCIECHVAAGSDHTPVSVYAEGQFCRRCHEYAGIDINCFGCHATVPTMVPGPTAVSGEFGPDMAQVPDHGAAAGGNTP